MSKNTFRITLMALVAMSFFKPTFSYAQKPFASKIKTPDTSKELKEDKSAPKAEDTSAKESSHQDRDQAPMSSSPAPRRLHQHGLGLGLGQTFLMGDYGRHGQDKITADVLYTYTASHSFDLLVDGHYSKHDDGKEWMKVMGLTGSIKARVVEFDNFSPFFLGGLGFYAPQAHRNGTGTTSQKVTFGANFGGGVDLRLNDRYVIGILAQMHWPFKVQQDSGSDLKGYYMKLLLTGMYLF